LPWIDYARRTVRSFRLKARRRIGIKLFSAIYSKPVTAARADVDGAGKISTCFRCQRIEAWLRASAVFYNYINLSSFWRPNAKVRFVFADYFGANGVAALRM
jgi:hypothetical protein